MILSHAHRFIFLRTQKTASSSIEIALSDLCGPQDVLAPLGRTDEAIRRARGKAAQNTKVPFRDRPLSSFVAKALGRSDRDALAEFYHHMPAHKVRRCVPSAVWRGYRKISVERNPWDREISFYFWRMRDRDRADWPGFERFVLAQTEASRLHNFEVYSLRGRIVAETMLRYEYLEEDFAALVRSLGVEQIPELPHAKSAYRPPEMRDYRTHYTPATRDAVARLYAREIEAFGYEF
jgi:hypothetical protein